MMKLIHRIHGFLLFIIWGFLLAACNPNSQISTPNNIQITVVVQTTDEFSKDETSNPTRSSIKDGYPAPTPYPTSSSGYPAPQRQDNEKDSNLVEGPLNIPEPSKGLGNVKMQFQATSSTSAAYLAGDIYLAKLIYTDGEVSIPFISIDLENDPKATLRNTNQEFAILNVPQGKYGIVLHNPIGDFPIPDGDGGFLIVEVLADETIDLGLIVLE